MALPAPESGDNVFLASFRSRTTEVEQEKLLSAVFPQQIAQQLLTTNLHLAASCSQDVSVLFVDLEGFTAMSAQKTPVEVCPVAQLLGTA